MTELIEWHEWQKIGYEKLKDKNLKLQSIMTAVQQEYTS